MQIIYNARIYTLDPSIPEASALVIDGGRILAVGESGAIRSQFGQVSTGVQAVDFQDLQGRTVLPGLIDAHLHLLQYALSLRKVDCETHSKALCLQRVAERASQSAGGEWI